MKLMVAVLVTFSAAVIGGMATRRAPEFYTSLSRPDWAPPPSVFGPVWSVLYVLMAIAVWLVWRDRTWREVRLPLVLFAIQLVLNALWSWLFFAWQMGGLAKLEIVVLLVFIVLTIIAFWRIRPLAGALLLPYLAWVMYATALTFSVVQRNPNVL